LPEEPKRQRISLPEEPEDSSDDELNEDEEWVGRFKVGPQEECDC
jgi:hypothetical protein